MSDSDSIHLYDYDLPPDLIAQYPAERRDASRLLVVNRKQQAISHHQFSELPELIEAGDLLVRNNTRVVPARLFGTRTSTGGKWEGLFLREEDDGRWRIIGQTRGKLMAGETVTLTSSQHSESVTLVLEERTNGGEWICRPESGRPLLELLNQFGTMPLPPYVDREAEQTDWDRYQTIYASRPGAVAAPTAGLHLTPEVLEHCESRGICSTDVTLHVGMGTFRPVSAERLSEHQMHSEWCELPEETAGAIQQTRNRNGRVVAVGTTAVRTLESVARSGEIRPWTGDTDLFIRPPYQFAVVDAMITNFHLPKSTLMVLVCTFAGRELMLDAYAEAIRERYRFFSYGDAMLIL
ncbi:MAG: tRNA preQ1(34) S-adenosylmethionine ribosyltransferase-isomerase QueA [Planctomycetaceae bacterium]|nr:tRNA preQ1(34) S-adenosylmethionine ribosyltransferase-isomerase QueA [Planctomycetaceae bacterium]